MNVRPVAARLVSILDLLRPRLVLPKATRTAAFPADIDDGSEQAELV